MSRKGDEAKIRFAELKKKAEELRAKYPTSEAADFIFVMLEEMEIMNRRVMVLEQELGPGDAFIDPSDVPHRLS